MEVLRLGIKSELQLPAYTIATATPDTSRVCGLRFSLWQCRFLNPLSDASILMDTMSGSFLFCLFRGAPTAYGGIQTRGRIGAIAAGLHHSHSNARSELCLRPEPQLTAMPDPQPTK